MNKILICHPDETIRETIKLILCDHYDLILTDSIPQSLDCLKHAKDINTLLMSVGNSDEFNSKTVARIKKDYPKLKIVAVVDYKGAPDAREAIRQGASGYIIKPFKPDAVLSFIGTLQTYSSI